MRENKKINYLYVNDFDITIINRKHINFLNEILNV